MPNDYESFMDNVIKNNFEQSSINDRWKDDPPILSTTEPFLDDDDPRKIVENIINKNNGGK